MPRKIELTEQPVNLHYNQAGESGRPDLIVLHGLFGSSTNWRTVVRELRTEFRITAVDLRNHGGSPWHADAGYPAMAEDVALLIRKLSLNSPSILGHSMGGKTAMCLVQSGLVSVDRLIVADIAPVSYSHSHLDHVNALSSIDLQHVSSRSDVDRQLATTVSDAGIRQFLLQNLVRDEGSFSWRINLEAIGNNMESLVGYPELPPSDVKTLFIRGERSDYIQDRYYPEIQRLFPDSRVNTINDAGHWLHAEQPERVIELTKYFLTR